MLNFSGKMCVSVCVVFYVCTKESVLLFASPGEKELEGWRVAVRWRRVDEGLCMAFWMGGKIEEMGGWGWVGAG